MTHQVGNWVGLGWVDFDLLELMKVWQKELSSWAGGVELPNKSQPNLVTDLMSYPVW